MLGEDPQAEKSRRRAALAVGELIDAFLTEHVSTKLKTKTRASYEPLLAKLREAHGSAKAAELSRGNVSALHRGMGSTPYLANRLLAAISSLYAWAESEGRLPEGHANPARGVKKFREESRERFLTSEELGRLGDALRAAEPRFGVHACAAIRLLILTGARLNEILHATWANIDFERGLLNLATSKAGRKSIYLNAAALALLSDLPRDESSPFIVPGEKAGQPRADLKRVWTAVTQAAGLEGLRAHDLRHSHASVGAGAGLSLPIIGRLLGHTQTATTQKYSHLSNDPVREASERIGSIIASSMDGSKSADIVPMRGGK
jgi:integrase